MSCGVDRGGGSNPMWLWLWCRPAAAYPIQPLAWEPPYATGWPKKKTTQNTQKRKMVLPASSQPGCPRDLTVVCLSAPVLTQDWDSGFWAPRGSHGDSRGRAWAGPSDCSLLTRLLHPSAVVGLPAPFCQFHQQVVWGTNGLWTLALHILCRPCLSPLRSVW